MNIPRLTARQRQVFSVLYAAPATVTHVARMLGITSANARELLAQLEFKNLVHRDGKLYAPQPWTNA